MEDSESFGIYGDETPNFSFSEIKNDLINEFYNCKICYELPRIILNENDKIIYHCGCQNSKDEEISTKTFFDRITYRAPKDMKKLICDEHKTKFSYFCNHCNDNKCIDCSEECDSHQHKLTDLKRNLWDVKRKILEIKSYEKYRYYTTDHCKKEDSDFIYNSIEGIDQIESSNEKINESSLISKLEKEDNNDYYLFNLFKIIFNHYENYPHYIHFQNIKNCYDFFINKFFPKKEIILTYKNDQSGKVKLFGKNFIKNNKENCYIKIGDKELELCEYFELNKNSKKDLVIKLIEKDNKRIIDMSYMFYESNLLSISEKSIWKIDKVNNLSNMFNSCLFLEKIPSFISDWDTSQVTDISYLFYNCPLLETIPSLSHWNTIKVINMNNIFYGCKKLQFIPKIDITNIQFIQKIVNNQKLSNNHKIADGIQYILGAVKKEEKIFEKMFKALIGEKEYESLDNNSPGYIHAEDALTIALYLDDVYNINNNFKLLVNSIVKEERNFYYIWYVLNKLIKNKTNNCQIVLSDKKILDIIINLFI